MLAPAPHTHTLQKISPFSIIIPIVQKAEVAALTRNLDTSGDGTIDFNEFADFFELHPLASFEAIGAKWAGVNQVMSEHLVPLPHPLLFWFGVVLFTSWHNVGVTGVIWRSF